MLEPLNGIIMYFLFRIYLCQLSHLSRLFLE